jgi:hypothetical protein
MRLCRCFLQTLGSSNRASLIQSTLIYLSLVHKILKHSNLSEDLLNINLICFSTQINLTFLSPTFGSLCSVSSMRILEVVMLSISISSISAPLYSLSVKSYILQSYKTFFLGNAGNLTTLIALAIQAGLNLTYMLHRVVCSSQLCIQGLLIKINPILFSGSNPIHYMFSIGFGSLYGSERQHDYSLNNVVGRFGSIGILVHLSYE